MELSECKNKGCVPTQFRRGYREGHEEEDVETHKEEHKVQGQV